jgi:hypothetical protein
MRALLLAALTLAACAAGAPPEAGGLAPQIRADLSRLDAELAAPGVVAAGLGEIADLGAGLTIRPLEVIEDSRCAANVQCVWAGRLRLRADVSGVERELTLGEPLQTPNGAVLLAVAKPGAWRDWPEAELARPAYRFGFRRA